MTAPLLALTLALAGVLAAAAATAGDPLPSPEPIPLRTAAIATPVRFPTVPPIGATPMFAPTATGSLFVRDHRHVLMRWYFPPRPEPEMGMH